jgi:amidase
MSWKLSLAALQAVALPALCAAPEPQGEPLFSINPNLLPLQENAGTDGLFPMADCTGFKLEEATFDDMRQAMEDGLLTSVQLVTCYLTRTYQTQEYIK